MLNNKIPYSINSNIPQSTNLKIILDLFKELCYNYINKIKILYQYIEQYAYGLTYIILYSICHLLYSIRNKEHIIAKNEMEKNSDTLNFNADIIE